MDVATVAFDGGGWSGPLPDMDSPSTLVLAFAGPGVPDHRRALAELRRAYPRSCLFGCSTAGTILDERIADDALGVAVARFETAGLRTAQAELAGPGGSRRAGEIVGEALRGDDLRAVLLLSDGLAVNGSELAAGIGSRLGGDIPVMGGLAADGDRFESTWVIADGRPRPGLASAVGLYGDSVRLGHGSRGGWDKFGPERLVTRSEGNVLYELDGRPALQLYRDYLGRRADGLPATGLLFPLAVRGRGDDEAPLVRTIVAVDEDRQSLTFAGDVPQGALAQLMRARLDRLVDGSEQAAIAAAAMHPDEDSLLALTISCVGRRLVLRELSEEEVEVALAVLPPGSRQLGFYAYGELAPGGGGWCDLHNQTMTIATISEA